MIFGNTLKERIDTSNELDVLHLKRRRTTIKATGITLNTSWIQRNHARDIGHRMGQNRHIRCGIRLVLLPRGRDCDFRWIVAHRAIDWRTGHLHETNLSSLAMSWTSQGAFFWSDVPQTEKGIHIETWLRWHIQKLNAWEPFNSMTVNQEYSSLNMWRKPVKKGLSTHHWPFIDEPPNE